MPAHRISEYYQCALASQIASRTMVLEHWEPVGRRVNFKLHAGFIVYFYPVPNKAVPPVKYKERGLW